MACEPEFEKADGFEEAIRLRTPVTDDIVARFGVISPNRILIHDYPLSHPLTAFNASVIYSQRDDVLEIYTRIILGYYLYVSSILRMQVPLDDLFNRYIDVNSYVGEVVIYPSTRYDLWGAEDPRVYKLDGKLYMTYTGRSINYYSAVRENRTLPVTAVYDETLRTWAKKFVFTLSESYFGKIISNKDAFLYRAMGGDVFLLHRPHLITDTFHLMISRVDEKLLLNHSPEIKVINVDNGVEVMRPAPFEVKIGWAAPIVNSKKNRIIALIHGIDRDSIAYKVFAAEFSVSKSGVAVDAVTPRYIMEPRKPYEILGDRPLTIFPCGAAKVGKDEIVVSYGAADTMIGFGILSLNNLMAELDKGRIY